MFIDQFVGAKDHQLPLTHLLSVKQRKDDSLNDYIQRGSKSKNCTDAVALTAIMADLRPGR